ncbi:MAG: hypothetical protein WC548_03120 [Candidatus Pacearchaeota archaeon]
MNEEPKIGEKYRHFKSPEKIYKIIAIATECKHLPLINEIATNYSVIQARDCDNPNDEYDVLIKKNSPRNSLLNNGRSDRKYVVYEQLYGLDNFPNGTIWIRTIDDFIGYKELPDGNRVKRFTKIK